jgi:metal transporter CNNM
MTAFIWIGIALCISQSAMLSGLNLAFFTISKLQLELEASKNNVHALKVLELRKDSNLLLVTILWSNVGVNVLLALLSGSVLAGVAAFFFSTVIITIFGEIMPQAYFSRNALKMGALLSPVLRAYRFVLYPIAKPTAMVLDRWLGPEAIAYFKEHDLREMIKMHMESSRSEIDKVEGTGSLNFLALDDLPVAAEGEIIDPGSIVKLEFKDTRPLFPEITSSCRDPFLQTLNLSGKKWIIIVDPEDQPRLALNSDKFIREAVFRPQSFNPDSHCHRPIIVRDGLKSLGEIIPRLKVNPERSGDDVIDEDIILYWGEEKHVITGSDILGRLLRGIVRTRPVPGLQTARA